MRARAATMWRRRGRAPRAATADAARRGAPWLSPRSRGSVPLGPKRRGVGLVLFLFGLLLVVLLLVFIFILLLRRIADALQVLAHIADRDATFERTGKGADESVAEHADDRG